MGPSLLALAPLLAVPQFVAVPQADSFDPTHELLEEMHAMVLPCVQPTATQRVFTLCYDTHSSIHAHWAAYRIARVVGWLDDAALASEVALEPQKVAYEVPFMLSPYAAAWFLRLVVDYELWSIEAARPDPFALRAVGDQMAALLTSALVTGLPLDPYAPEYWNPAWGLAQLHAYYEHVGDDANRVQVEARVRAVFGAKITGASFGDDLALAEFFSVYGNWSYVVVKTQPRPLVDAFLALQDPTRVAELVPPNGIGLHASGMFWSRTWALRAMSAATPDPIERDRWARAADLHVLAGMQQHELLKGAWIAYDHWVPQFAVYAVTEGLVSD